MKTPGLNKHDSSISNPEAEMVRRLTRKLEAEGDISLEEADGIFSFFDDDDFLATRLNTEVYRFDRELAGALKEWYRVVGEKVKKGSSGNFIFTVCFDEGLFSIYMLPAQNAIKKRGRFEDLCTTLMVDKRLYSSLPFGHLLEKTRLKGPSATQESFYKFSETRAGIYYYPVKTEKGYCTIEQTMKNFYPAMAEMSPERSPWNMDYARLEVAFEIASGGRDMSECSWNVCKESAKAYVMGEFMNRARIPCITAADVYRGSSILFTEKKNAPAIKKALEIPFEELVENALKKNIIDETSAQQLLSGQVVRLLFPTGKFIKTSGEYVDNIVRLEMRRKAEHEAVQNEDFWLEEMR